MKGLMVFILSLLLWATEVWAVPRVAVLPFDMIVDSDYGFYGDKVSLLNYGEALQEMISTDLARHKEIGIVELSAVRQEAKKEDGADVRWNDATLASRIGSALKADYVVTGSYGEYSSEIRVDSRVVTVATGEVLPENTVSATVGMWADLSTAAEMIVNGLIPILTVSGRLRPASTAIMYPEGDLADYDPAGAQPAGMARLVIFINAPAPQIKACPATDFGRCERIDLMNIPAEMQRRSACRSAVLPAGPLEVTIAHRGFLPYREDLNLSAGKVYRLEVNLVRVEVPIR